MAYYGTLCGCWFPVPTSWGGAQREYLPQVQLESHTTIISSTSRTLLKQTFVNTQTKKLDEVQYTFPLYDGVSVVGFKCTVADKVLVGVVKEKQQARKDYQAAVDRGETAGLLEQLPEASDVFTTKVGNVPAGEKVYVEITYLGELKHDAETDGSRFTIPTVIAPRYGTVSDDSASILNKSGANDSGGIKILVDVALDEGSIIRGLQSPSHPIAVSMGRTSTMDEEVFDNTHASATLTMGKAELEKDFVIVVLSKEQGIPKALLETHPTITGQRALMATLVPKFNIPNIAPEIVFVVDRSGSMEGKMNLVISALNIFLKSIPANGTKFNICSFGSHHSFLFKKSKTYDESSLKEALKHVSKIGADFGGTEMLNPVKATCQIRYKDMPLEVMVLTDGEIWNQDELFSFINEQKNARFFTLGIGDGASSALVEGIARAGNGFAQFVGDDEKMDKRVVRMLKGALTPHIDDYKLEVHYGDGPDEDFEMIESTAESMTTVVGETEKEQPPSIKKTISLFDTSAKEKPTNPPDADRFSGLPTLAVPKVLQAPYKVPALYPFNRTTVYLLLSPEAPQKTVKSVTLRGTSEHGPLELQIPVQDIGRGETLHQLAAKKAVHELEHGRGWITDLKTDNKPLKSKYEGRWDLIVEREAVRLGVQFQVGGKHCSFVAVENKDADAVGSDEKESADGYEVVAEQKKAPKANRSQFSMRSRGAGGAQAQAPARFGGPPAAPGAAPLMCLQSAAPVPPPPAMAMCDTSMLVESSTASLSQQSAFGTAAPMAKRSRMAFPQSSSLDGGFMARAGAIGSFFSSGPAKAKAGAPRRMLASKAASPSVPAPRGGAAQYDMRKKEAYDPTIEDSERMEYSVAADDESLEESVTKGSNEGGNDDKMHKLIELQSFDGPWDSSSALWKLIGVDKAKAGTVLGGKDEKAIATIMAVAWLVSVMESEEEVWEMVVDKARSWLDGRIGSTEVDKALAKAKGVLGA